MASDYDDKMKALGHAIRDKRADLGISQRELAARSKLHHNYICGIERGDRNPTILILWKLCDALECEISEVLE